MYLSILWIATLTAIVLQTSALAASTGPLQTIQRRPPFLKINDYTVLYLNPVAPYQDAQGTLVAPVSRLAALLGIDAKTASDGNTVTLSRNGQTVAFTVSGPPQANVKPGSFSKPIRWHGTGEIIAPVEEVALGLGIRFEWNPDHRVFQMHSSDALSAQEYHIHGFPFPDFTPDPAISLVSFRMNVSSKPSGLDTVKYPAEKGFETEYPYRYQIVLRNNKDRSISDDSVVDVIDEEPPGIGADTIGKPGTRTNGEFTQIRRAIIVHPSQIYRLKDWGADFHPIVAVLIATGSKLK